MSKPRPLLLGGPAWMPPSEKTREGNVPEQMQEALARLGVLCCPGTIAQSPGREAALAWVSLAKRFPASSVLAREGAGCGRHAWRLAGLSSALAVPLDLGARPLCRRLRGRGCANCQSLQQAELFVTRLLHPWDFPRKSTGVGCHCLLPYLCTSLPKSLTSS